MKILSKKLIWLTPLAPSLALDYANCKEQEARNNAQEINDNLKKNFDANTSLLLSFAYHGELPGEADVKIFVGDKYKKGDKLNFYYNNTEENKIELISENVIVDKDGYVTVSITHCSEYILNLANNIDNPGTYDGVTTHIIIYFISLIGLVGATLY